MLTLEEIKTLMSPKTRFTKEIKEKIANTANAYGITLPNCKCRNKWYDVLVLIYKKMKVMETHTADGKPKVNEHFTYLRPNDVVIRGKRFGPCTHDDDIRWLMIREPNLFKLYYKVND